MYCGLSFLTFGLCAITGSQARLALSAAFWILLNYKASPSASSRLNLVCLSAQDCCTAKDSDFAQAPASADLCIGAQWRTLASRAA